MSGSRPVPFQDPRAPQQIRAEAPDVRFLERYRRLRLRLGLVVLALAVLGGIGYQALRVKTIGAPFGEGVGTAQFVALLTETQEPYVPALQRNPDQDRFAVHLLVQPLQGQAPKRLLKLQSHLRASEARNASRILGFDGRLLWIQCREIMAYDHRAGALIREERLRRTNPSLATLLDQGIVEVADRLRISARDRSALVEIDPETLVAKHLPWTRNPRDTARVHPVDSYLLPSPAADPARLDPAVVADAGRAGPLRLMNPDGRLLASWRKTSPLQRQLIVARLDSRDQVVWESDTGLGQLQQIFPHPESVVFLGTRPPQPGKLPEPVLAILRTDSGKVSAESLWVRP